MAFPYFRICGKRTKSIETSKMKIYYLEEILKELLIRKSFTTKG